MTNTEARKIAFNECKVKCVAYEEDCENMSIGECRKRLEALEQEPCEDCISRKEMLKYQEYLHGKMSNEENHKLWEFIKELPSVNPQEPKTGHWIYHRSSCGTEYRECSNCMIWFLWDMPRNSYCPNCGAKMEE